MRYFNPPSITSKYNNTSELCWRGCGLVGDFTHTFFDCPKLIEFWKDVQKEIKQILGINITLEPAIVLLGIPPDNEMDGNTIYLLKILLLIAKKMITVSWLKPQPPSISQWRERIKNVLTMEKLTAKLQLKVDTFNRKWAPIIFAMNDL